MVSKTWKKSQNELELLSSKWIYSCSVWDVETLHICIYSTRLPVCIDFFATASTDLGVRKGKGTVTLGSVCVEQKTEAGYPPSGFQDGPILPQRLGGLWFSRSPFIK